MTVLSTVVFVIKFIDSEKYFVVASYAKKQQTQPGNLFFYQENLFGNPEKK